MIDFPQMVSVCHRNAQMYFDRDLECIFRFFQKRFKLSFELQSDEDDCKDGGVDDNGRPSFSSISKAAGSLDKELAASGFTKKDQDVLERFVEAGSGDPQSSEQRTDDSGADGEPEDHQQKFDELNESDVRKLDSLSLIEQGHDVQENLQASLSGPSSEAEVQDASSQEGRNDEDDPELMKRLSKQRQSAIASARGRRQTITHLEIPTKTKVVSHPTTQRFRGT